MRFKQYILLINITCVHVRSATRSYRIIRYKMMIIFIFMAADEYKASAIHEGKSYGWATAAKIAVVLLTLSAIGNIL